MAFPPPIDLLPHRPPMLLLGAVLSHEAEKTCCEATVDPTFAAACGGLVPSAFGLEMIAQAAAVHHALIKRESGDPHVPAARGLLLGSRRLQVASGSIPVGEPLRVTVLGGGQPPGAGGLIRFEGNVENAAGEIIASGDATVLEWRPDIQVA